MVGPFIFFDQFGPAEFLTGQGIDVRLHPHIGLTYLREGHLHHRDSLGTDAYILPVEINLMTAGQGITHSQRVDGEMRKAPFSMLGLQTWLAMPKTQEDTPAAELPVLEADCGRARGEADAFGRGNPGWAALHLVEFRGLVARADRRRA